MRNIFLIVIIFLSCLGCKSQEFVRYKGLKYEGYSYHETLNKSFINKRMVFLNGADSIIFNIKIPFSFETKETYDPGIFYNCTLTADSLYSFELKKVSLSAIPKEYNSYYLTNGRFSSANKSRFTEVKLDTKYQYQGNNGMFIDLNNELYRIEKMTPARDCVFQH